MVHALLHWYVYPTAFLQVHVCCNLMRQVVFTYSHLGSSLPLGHYCLFVTIDNEVTLQVMVDKTHKYPKNYDIAKTKQRTLNHVCYFMGYMYTMFIAAKISFWQNCQHWLHKMLSKVTTFHAANDKNFIEMTKFLFECEVFNTIFLCYHRCLDVWHLWDDCHWVIVIAYE